MTDRYSNNAFRVLGLLPDASMRDILGRVNEIKIKKPLGMDIVFDYDFPWMGALDRSDENVTHALQRLENPVLRLKEEMFWFWVEGEEDRQALALLGQYKIQAAHDLWGKDLLHAQDGGSPKEIARATHNQAVLAHAVVIGKEIDVKYSDQINEERIVVQKESETLYCPTCSKNYEKGWKVCSKCGTTLVIHKSDRKETTLRTRDSKSVLSERHWKNWRFAISRFDSLNSSEEFWSVIRGKIRHANDPRMPESKLHEFRESYLLDITEPNQEFISRGLAAKDYERVKWHSNFLNGVTMEAVVLKEGFDKTLHSRIERLNQFSSSAEKTVKGFGDLTSRDDALALYSEFKSNIKETIYEGNLVDINCISDFSLARDNVAEALRSLSVQVHNRFDDYKASYDIISDAVECAASSYVRQRLQKDAEMVREHLLSGEAPRQASGSQSKKKDPGISPEQSSQPPPVKGEQNNESGEMLRKIPWWAWVVGFFALMAMFSTGTSSQQGSYTGSTSSARASRAVSAGSRTQLENQISALKESIRMKEAGLRLLDDQIQTKQAEKNRSKMYIETIEAQYAGNRQMPAYVYADYSKKIDQYNDDLFPAYNQLIDEYKALDAACKADIDRHNQLAHLYNSKN